jgi:hypothetical protein
LEKGKKATDILLLALDGNENISERPTVKQQRLKSVHKPLTHNPEQLERSTVGLILVWIGKRGDAEMFDGVKGGEDGEEGDEGATSFSIV